MQCHGWSLLFHDGLIEQLQRLKAAADRPETSAPGFEGNAGAQLYSSLSRAILEAVPSDPGKEEYRLGNTAGMAHCYWRRVKLGSRFRLFFRFDSKSKVIVFAWVRDRHALPSGSYVLDASQEP